MAQTGMNKKSKSNNSGKDVKNIDDKLNLESERIIFQIMKEEYDREHQRTAYLDNKASVFIAAIIAALTIFIPAIPYKGIADAFRVKKCHTGIILILILLGVSAICIVTAFIELYCAFKLKGFGRPNLEKIDAEDNLKKPETVLLDDLIIHYHIKVIRISVNENNDKARHLQKGILLFVVGFMMMFAAVIILSFFVA